MSEARKSAPWSLDPEIVFLNHGSFGACPVRILELQSEIRARLEREPVRFLTRELEPQLDAARAALGSFVGADPDDLAFVSNASSGVSTVLRSLDFAAGDELLVTDHAYNACANALRYVADRAGARVVVANVPFPLGSPSEVVEAIVAAIGPRTRLALLDHVTSPTGLVFPIAEIVAELSARGVDALVDGAHAPGMVVLDLQALGAAYYTGNCHKWLCAPKGAAFLHVRRDRQEQIRPLTISHGANSPRRGRSRFRLEFDWTGSRDPSAVLCVPEAIRFLGTLVDGGWPALRARNRRLALRARAALEQGLNLATPCPEEMVGSLAALPLPATGRFPEPKPAALDPLQDALLFQHGIEVPIVAWPSPPHRLVRISAQLYNAIEDYERLAAVLADLL
jgi:isopenicillin-N epimerase